MSDLSSGLGFDTLFGDFFEGDIKMKAAPKTTKEQQDLLKSIISWLSPQIGKGAEAYPGQLPGTADVQINKELFVFTLIWSNVQFAVMNLFSACTHTNPKYLRMFLFFYK